MTPGFLTYAAFALVCLLILTLPFIPAVREWRHPTDASALPVSANYTSDIDHFARRLHADVSARMGEGPATGYEEFDLVPATGRGAGALEKARRRLIVQGSLHSDAPLRVVQPLYVRGHLHAGEASMFSAVYATGDLRLGAESVADDWLHAGGVLTVGDRGIALRRASAGKGIVLGEETWFERLQAPVLLFGGSDGGTAEPFSAQPQEVPATASYADLPGALRRTSSLYFIRGDCTLPAGQVFHGSLVVTGYLRVGEGTTIFGDVKAREGASLGAGAMVYGAVTSEKRIFMMTRSRALGPVISETDILIGARATVGTLDAQTTISARNIIAERGAMVHGSVWAHEIGMVKAA